MQYWVEIKLSNDATKEEAKRQELIETLERIIEDLKRGCGGFMHLYDELVSPGK